MHFCSSRNGEALLRMSDTAALKLININIDSIQVECKTSIEKELHVVEKGCAKTGTDLRTKQGANGQSGQNNANKTINYFFLSCNVDADTRKSSKLMWEIHNTSGDVFNGIGCFEGTFSLQLKPYSKPYQVPPRSVAYVLQKPFKEELECLQKMDIITLLGVDEMAEWCNSFVLVPKANGKVRLCLNPTRLNQTLIRPIHRGPTLNNILPRLNNVMYMSIINANLGYHNLQLDTKSSYLTTFMCPFGRYHYKCLPFGGAPVGNMFQHKISEIFSDIPNVFGITDDILVTGYNKNGKGHDEAVYNVLRWCKEVNLKLNKDQCHFRCMSIPFFGKGVSREGIQPDPQKIKTLTDMPMPNNKRELQASLGIINYLGKFSPGMVELCDPLWKLTLSKAVWTWNMSYQQLFMKVKSLIKVDVCMKFYEDTKLLYLETDASRVGMGAALLQLHDNTMCHKDMAPDNTILCPIAFVSKSLTEAEQRCSNIKREALGILHGLEKIHHYCFGRKVLIITNHILLVSIFKKDLATLLQFIQCIMLKIHQYRVQIIYKPGPKFFIADWLPWHNHVEGKDKPIKDTDIRIDAIQSVTYILECMSILQIQQASIQDDHLQHLKSL